MLYTYQSYKSWLQKNPSYLEYLEEQVRIIDIDLQFPTLLSKEEKDYLKKEKEYFLAEIQRVKWAKIIHQQITNKETKTCQ